MSDEKTIDRGNDESEGRKDCGCCSCGQCWVDDGGLWAWADWTSDYSVGVGGFIRVANGIVGDDEQDGE